MRKRSLISVFMLLAIILLVSTFKTEVFAQTTPKVAIVSLDHVPFVEGDKNEFYISAKDYTGQVQYQLFYIQESVMKEWKLINNVDMVNGWTKPVDAQTPVIVGISSLNLKADNYRFAIRVRRVGVQGLKQNSYGDYDDAYPFTLDVVKAASIELSGNMNIEKTNFTKNEDLAIDGVAKLSGNVQYKLHLFDVKNNKWLTDLTDYNMNVSYSLKNIPEGTYIVDLWAKNSESKNKYDGWKLKVITIYNPIIKVASVSLIQTFDSLMLDKMNNLMVGETNTLIARVNPPDATNNSVKWTSSDNNIAIVDNIGKVTAVSAGTATITVTTEDGSKTATCSVTVKNPIIKVSSVSLNKTTDFLIVGKTDNLIASVNSTDEINKSIAWKSTNPEVATVDNTGKVTGISNGTTTITVTMIDGNKSATCTVTVSSSVTCIIKNETLTNRTIDGDLYVDENIVVTIEGNLTVNGNLYVHGCIKNYGNIIVINTMHLGQLSWDEGIANGKVCMLSNQNIYMGTDIGTMIFDIDPTVK